jgi:hypothetical protein
MGVTKTGKYSIPKEINKFKPPGTFVKVQNGIYYVYEQKSIKNKNTNKWGSKSGSILGKITLENGFISNGTDLTGQKEIKEYGNYAYIRAISEDIFTNLKECFDGETAITLYVIAIINAVNGFTHYKNYKTIYENSYLSLIFPTVSLSKNTVSAFFSRVGRSTTEIDLYHKKRIESSIDKKFAIDGHDIATMSEKSDLSFYGNKYGETGEKQTNIIVMLDIETKCPVASRAINGADLDKTGIVEFLNIVPVKNSVLIVDKGFFSEANLTLFRENGNHFIIPLQKNLKTYKDVIKDLKYDNKFIFESGKHDKLINCKSTMSGDLYIHICQDTSLAKDEEIEYMKHLNLKEDGYSMEELNLLSPLFGTIVLLTDLKWPSSEVYASYKKRWSIETMFNGVKNGLDYHTIGLQDYCQMQTIAFLLILIGTMWRLSLNKLKSSVLANKFSYWDAILETSCLKLESHYKTWTVQNVKPKKIELYNELGISIKY